MKRLFALLLGVASVANAGALKYEKTDEPPGTVIYAAGYGVKANGTTSDDVALKAAADACNTAGGHLILPSGTILLDGTGGNSIVLDGCWMQGSGGNAGYTGKTQGTTFNITSTSVSPFKLEKNFKVSDASFYWPNQTDGITVYPVLFADGGTGATVRMTHGIISGVTIVNAYDAITVTAGGGTGDVKVLDSTIFAVHRAFTLLNTGDSWVFNNLRMTPGPWLNICNNSAPCMAAVNAGGLVNSIFDIASGGTVTITLSNTVTFDWRYGIYIESGALLGASNISWTLDGMGSIIDSSANSTAGKGYSALSQMTGSMTTCGAVITYSGGGAAVSGHLPCFNLGANSGLRLENMRFGAAQGDFIDAAGTNNIRLTNISLEGIGNIVDGNDYYFLNASGGTQQLRMYDSYIIGVSGAADAHSAHGINYQTTNPFSTGAFTLKNNYFSYMTDVLTVNTINTQVIDGNVSLNTYSSGATLNVTGLNTIKYDNNYWDIDPTAAPITVTRGSAPANLHKWGVPVILPPSGDFNAGVVTLGTALTDAKWCTSTAGCYMYFPSGAICATCISAGASPAGVYFCQNSGTSTTVFNCFNNVLSSGKPVTIASPTAFVSPGDPAGYTSPTTVVTLLSFRIPPNVMGPQGEVNWKAYVGRASSANAVTLTTTFGGTVSSQTSVVSTQWYGVYRTIQNTGSTGQQVVLNTTSLTATSDLASANTAPLFMAIDTTAAVTFNFRGTLAAATDFLMIDGGLIQSNYGAAN